jgi:hypothetical protein
MSACPLISSENTALLAKKNNDVAIDRPDRHSPSWRPQLLDRPNCIGGWGGLTGVSARRFTQNGLCRPCQWARRPRAALARALARYHARQSSLEYAGLRGEGSTPVPLPPPAWPQPLILWARLSATGPILAAISDLSSGLLIGKVGSFFSEWLISLRSCVLREFGTVLEIRVLRAAYEV